MSSSPSVDWSRMRELFDRALALPPEERPGFLGAACGDNAILRERVERLLDSHERGRNFLDGGIGSGRDASFVTANLEGRRIGPYQVQARVGVGGMGEVYRARDTRLDRTVAIKVLSARIDSDPQFRERFHREARAIGALNHPHICVLYDVGQDHSTGSDRPFHYIVMEYVEGETLATRVAKGALPREQALRIGAQVAGALDRAHRAGIVHRDLKPSNIMLTKQGAKLLDFGIAQAHADLEPDRLTATGVVLGTLAYMAPEQLHGGPSDARTDIFALGLVLSEMVTGKTSFNPTGDGALDRVIRRCLAEEPDERWQSAADLASELDWMARGSHQSAAQVTAPRAEQTMTRSGLLRGIFVAAVAMAATIGVMGFLRNEAPRLQSPKRFAVSLTDVAPGLGSSQFIRVAPDGSALVYLGGDARAWRLHVYAMLDGTSRPLPGTERAVGPFFSPDGKWLAFFQGSRLMKVALAGGPPILICEPCSGPSTRGHGSWGANDLIVFSTDTSILRVAAGGGSPTALTSLAQGERWHLKPHLLPGADAALFTVLSGSGDELDAAIEAVALATGQRRTVITSATDARYSDTGHLLFVRGSNLLAAAFDVDRLQITGSPVPLVSDVRLAPLFLDAGYDMAQDGTLTYLRATAQSLRSLVWINKDGTERHAPLPQRSYFNPSLLPDERSVIVELEETPHNLWHADLSTGALTRLTHEGANHRAVLSADGQWMIFSSDRTPERSLFRQPTDGSGAAERLTIAAGNQNASSWSRDGKWLAFTQIDPRTSRDIWMLPLETGGKPKPFLQTPYSEEAAVFSPDGKLLAYVSNQSGRDEVMLTTFPGPGPRLQVSVDGGQEPAFSADGHIVFYRASDRVLAAEITATAPPRVTAPRVAFELPPSKGRTGLPNFAVNRKGDEVLTVKYLESDIGVEAVQVVVNWVDLFRRTAAAQ